MMSHPPNPNKTDRIWSPRAYSVLSISAAIMTIALKFGAYRLTNSVGLLSDAIESCVNLIAAVVAFWALTIAKRPPDAKHAFGYSKTEYFSSALEAILIIIAAVGIAVTAGDRLIHPQPLEQNSLGLGISTIATMINGSVGFILLRAGKRLRSITLRTDAHHLFTDVWTSVGVLLGVLLVQLTGWLVLDSIIAILVAVNIMWIGFRLLRETGSELLDEALPAIDRAEIDRILNNYKTHGIQFHALRTRIAGSRRFVSFHVLVPATWTVKRGHDLCDAIELAIGEALPLTHIITHLEPLEDPLSLDDRDLDRIIKTHKLNDK